MMSSPLQDSVSSCESLLSLRGFGEISHIASGSSGVLFQCLREKQPRVAKCVDLHTHSGEYEVEKLILSRVSHPNILQVFHSFQTPDTGVLLIERMDTDAMEAIQEPLSQDTLFSIFYQVGLAIQHLHEQGIAHLDIKPENILVRSSSGPLTVKVADFGAARQFVSGCPLSARRCGTFFYCAPEVNADECYLGDKADVWSLGILLHVLLTGTWPYHGKTQEEIQSAVREMDIRYHPRLLTDEVMDLLDRMLHPNPECRPPVKEILSHSLFKSCTIPIPVVVPEIELPALQPQFSSEVKRASSSPCAKSSPRSRDHKSAKLRSAGASLSLFFGSFLRHNRLCNRGNESSTKVVA